MRTERNCETCGAALVMEHAGELDHQPSPRPRAQRGLARIFRQNAPKPTAFDRTGWRVTASGIICPECQGKAQS
jgi:hypothetical protein